MFMVDEIAMLRNENNKLKSENERLFNELNFIKQGRSTTAATEVRVDRSRTLSVAIICMLIQGKKMQDILNKLSISKSTYYRAISERTISDSQYMESLYIHYKHLFDEYGIEKEVYENWIENRSKHLTQGYIADGF